MCFASIYDLQECETAKKESFFLEKAKMCTSLPEDMSFSALQMGKKSIWDERTVVFFFYFLQAVAMVFRKAKGIRYPFLFQVKIQISDLSL